MEAVFGRLVWILISLHSCLCCHALSIRHDAHALALFIWCQHRTKVLWVHQLMLY